MKEVGLPLMEVYEMSLREKLLHAEHFAAYDEHEQRKQEQAEEDYEVPDVGSRGMKRPPNTNVDAPTSVSQPRGATGGSGRAADHPRLQQYDTVVNVQSNEGVDSDRVREIQEDARKKDGVIPSWQQNLEPDPDHAGEVTVFRRPREEDDNDQPIEQAGDG